MLPANFGFNHSFSSLDIWHTRKYQGKVDINAIITKAMCPLPMSVGHNKASNFLKYSFLCFPYMRTSIYPKN